MKHWRFFFLLLLISGGTTAQPNTDNLGYIHQFDCRIDSFILSSPKISYNEFRKYTYDKSGSIVGLERFTISASGDRLPFERILYGYDDAMNQVEVSTDTYDKNSSIWINAQKEEKTFDSKQRITSEATYVQKNPIGRLVGTNKKETVYLSDRIEECTVYQFNTEANDWAPTGKTRTERNGEEHITEIYYTVTNGAFVEKSKCVIERTADSQSEMETFFDKNETWNPVFRRVFSLNPLLKKKIETTECYDSEKWISIYKQEITLNAQNEVISLNESCFDTNTEQWRQVKNETFEKNYVSNLAVVTLDCTMGNVRTATQSALSYKDDTYEAKTTLSYGDGAPSTVLSTVQTTYKEGYLKNFSFAEGVISDNNRKRWNWDFNETEKTISMNYESPDNPYTIHFFIGNINRTPTPSVPNDTLYGLKIYPNPVVDILTIEHKAAQKHIGMFSLFDQNGRQIRRGSLENPQTRLNLGNLSTGIYLMSVRFGDNTPTSKVIIKQ